MLFCREECWLIPVPDLQKPSLISLTDVLMGSGLLDATALNRALRLSGATGQSIVVVLHQLAMVPDADVVAALTSATGVPQIDSSEMPTQRVELDRVNLSFLKRHRVIPLGFSNDELAVGVIDPTLQEGVKALAFLTGVRTSLRLMSVSDQNALFDKLYDDTVGEDDSASVQDADSLLADTLQVRDRTDAGPAVRIVDAILEQAIERNASDIHIEPLSDRVRIRFRVDGQLIVIREEAATLAAPIAARVKVIADMDIANRRSAQDGRTSIAARGRPIDVRISSVPSVYGETIAMRLLRRDTSLLHLPALGFGSDVLGIFDQVLKLRRGLFLLTGPTGSGKTTTLYAMLERLRASALKILSIEDPIEYFFPDVTQVQVNEDAGVTFPSALRSFLRQDPDVILVGEIRDGETARIAVQAALTGHLVLATLHTPDAAGTVPRLTEMGIDRYLVAATLAGAVAQRLVPRLCPHCRHTRPPSPVEKAALFNAGAQNTLSLSAATGCAKCRDTGVAGRIAVAEGFLVDPEIRTTMTQVDGSALTDALVAQRFRPLRRAAFDLLETGDISLADALALEGV